jgi:ribosomal protein L11 methyltransferase
MNRYIQISIETKEEESKDILIALLSEIGYEGFEEQKGLLHSYINESAYDEQKLTQVLPSTTISFKKNIIEETNWNEQWEKSFDPVIVDDFCTVRASFHKPAGTTRYEIIITPQMSFGTGHHATTYLMIEEMKHLDFKNKTVLDFGTGTGILSILANKLGAETIYAIDIDDWSIQNAAENIKENHCQNILLEKSGGLDMTGKFDIVLANINKNVILANMAAIQQHLQPGAVVLLSGLLSNDRTEIEEKARNSGLKLVKQQEKDSWILLRLSPDY